MFDIWLCNQPEDASLPTGNTFCLADLDLHHKSGWESYAIGMSLTILGIIAVWMGAWRPDVVIDNINHEKLTITPLKAVVRFVIVYTLGMAAVNLWRGVWYLTDTYLLPDRLQVHPEEGGAFPLASYWVSSLLGSTVCFILFSGASLLAPPAIFLLDGPGVNPPPLAVTVMSSFYSLTLPAKKNPPDIPVYIMILDVLLSFVVVPIFVVIFWRGSWLVLDYYLWGFSLDPHKLHLSLLWNFLLAAGLMVITSDPVFNRISSIKCIHPEKYPLLPLKLLSRLRTYLLAWGTVNFWRVVWYIWDEFIGGPSLWSCLVSHIVPLILLASCGCLSCIVAPASTLGVDALCDPLAAEEPLFSNLPVPSLALYFGAIFRQPVEIKEEQVLESFNAMKEFYVSSVVSSIQVRESMVDAPGEGSVQAADSNVDSPGEEEDLENKSQQTTVSGEARLAQESLSKSWYIGGTGTSASYSSVRHSSAPRQFSSSMEFYLDMQRPDLDRRESSTGLGLSSRRSSVCSRSR